MPFFNEIAHIPLLVYHPDLANPGSQRRKSLTQTTDIMPTLLELFGLAPPPTVGASK